MENGEWRMENGEREKEREAERSREKEREGGREKVKGKEERGREGERERRKRSEECFNRQLSTSPCAPLLLPESPVRAVGCRNSIPFP